MASRAVVTSSDLGLCRPAADLLRLGRLNAVVASSSSSSDRTRASPERSLAEEATSMAFPASPSSATAPRPSGYTTKGSLGGACSWKEEWLRRSLDPDSLGKGDNAPKSPASVEGVVPCRYCMSSVADGHERSNLGLGNCARCCSKRFVQHHPSVCFPSGLPPAGAFVHAGDKGTRGIGTGIVEVPG